MLTLEETFEKYDHIIKRMVTTMCIKYDNFIPKEDIQQASYEGVIKAYHKYDPNNGAKFETYMCIRIFGTVTDMIRDMRSFPKAAYMTEENKEKRRKKKNIKVKEKYISRPVPVQHVIEFLYDVHDPETETIQYTESFHELISVLDPIKNERYISILKMYYLYDLNLREIGVVLGISESRVSQLITVVIKRLRISHNVQVAASAA